MGILDFFRAPPSPEKFAKLALQAFADGGHGAPLRYDAAEFRLEGVGGSPAIYNLHNVYREYNAAPRAARPALLANFVKAFVTSGLPPTFAEARGALLPVLRGRGTLEYLRLVPETLIAGKPYIDASAPFSSDSVIMLAYDSEFSIQTLTGATLSDWGVSFDEALAAAVDNLRDATVAKFEPVSAGLYVGAWGDSYDTSRILFADIFYRLEVGGEPVVMMPTRDRLLVASSNNHAGLTAMLALAHTLAEEDGRAVSALMYRFQNGGAVEYVPDDAELLGSLRNLQKIYLAEDYASQKKLLDIRHQQLGIDVFVANYTLVEKNDTGRYVSYGVWTDSVDTLLPEVELVALSTGVDGDEGQTKLVAWADLRAQVEELSQSQEGYPARYRLKTFPDKALIDALSDAKF
ncbi:hypothetical protein [Duganella aceris]|uniref:DUF1444 family protein n=1 Tax=Duganella aceris TaxID=2703883 RepID=A0ABX0FHG5_9BURK|nr:hypothetical protein [Duganella aceris]NGZ84025.1 hypothetical protein [Duganella aceris]